MLHAGGTKPDVAGVEATLEDYLLSWLRGDPERMAACLHPRLAKRTQADPMSGSLDLEESPFDALVASAGRGHRPYAEAADIKVQSVAGGKASASIRSEPWLDLVHLGWFGDRWRVVNVLYEPRSTVTASADDERAIQQLIDGYAAAGFDDDAEAIRRSHHPALAERRVIVGEDGALDLEASTFAEVLEITERGLDMGRFPRAWETRLDDTGAHIAAANVVAGWYDLDLHLARFGPRWLIVNVSYRILDPPS